MTVTSTPIPSTGPGPVSAPAPDIPRWAVPGSAAVTGLGAMPGTDALEATRVVAGELAGFPHLPQLPARGPAGSAVARSAAMLVDLHVDLQPSGWRITDAGGMDEGRARSAVGEDLDAAEEVWDGYVGPFKVQADGPFTLAVALDRSRGDAVLADSGARRDVAASLTEGLRVHVADLARRIPGASLVVQVDEPLLATVLAGGVPTASGFGRLRAVTDAEVRATLRRLADALSPVPLVVCVGSRLSAPSPSELPDRLLWDALDGSGIAGLGLEPGALDDTALDRLAVLVEAGVTPWLAALRPADVLAADDRGGIDADSIDPDGGTRDRSGRIGDLSAPPRGAAGGVRDVARTVVDLWRRLGFPPGSAAAGVVVTPARGLATLSPADARRVLSRLVSVGPAVAEDAAGRP